MFIIVKPDYSQVEKYDREHLARKRNLEVTTKDMFDRQQVAGDPEVRQFDRQVMKYKYKINKTLDKLSSQFVCSPSVAYVTATTTTQFPAHLRHQQLREKRMPWCKV